jgi:cobalt/nickel transport system ATP-binding protein
LGVLELHDVHYRYPGQTREALRGTTWRLPVGARVALIGRNGSGKSTLLLHCNGTLRPDRGEVRLADRTVNYDRRGLIELRRQIGLVFQNPDDQLFSASVAQDISFGPLNLGLSTGAARERVAEAAALCEIEHLLDRPTHALSGGEKTRVALAGVLAMDPAVLIADEVLASLDPWIQQQMFDIFERLVRAGKTVVLATHDLATAFKWADVLAVMHAGQIVASDAPERVWADQAVMQQTGLAEFV